MPWTVGWLYCYKYYTKNKGISSLKLSGNSSAQPYGLFPTQFHIYPEFEINSPRKYVFYYMYNVKVHRHPTKAKTGEVNRNNKTTTAANTSAHKVSTKSDLLYVNKQTGSDSTILSDDYVLLSHNTFA